MNNILTEQSTIWNSSIKGNGTPGAGWEGPDAQSNLINLITGRGEQTSDYDLYQDNLHSPSPRGFYVKKVGGTPPPTGTTTPPPGAISGCTNKCANNYNASATVDDGSCTYNSGVIPGCTDSSATNYDANATCDDGSCRGGGILPIKKPKFTEWCLTNEIVPSDPINDQWKQLIRDVRDGKDPYEKNAYVAKLIWIQKGDCDEQPSPIPRSSVPRLVMFGEDLARRKTLYLIEPNPDNPSEMGYIDHTQGNIWYPFHGYRKINANESIGLKNILMEEENNSLSEMIDDKLREFNFYSANDKGKQKVVFTDEDREEISKEFDDLIKKYPEDIAFIRAVVIAKGEDKKSGEPIVRLGSYYNNADIELPFNSQMNGLGKLLDGGIVYFTIINNEGPDYRDFKIVGGDKIPEVEFNDKDKEEIELDNYTHSHDEEMAEMNEPFEEVMKKKEQKGLASLLEKGDLTNDLTKRQKEVLENLKKKGFKFEKPENADIYERVRVSSKEFNESIKAWKPRK